MALPTLTTEQRARALEKAAEARLRRAEFKRDLKAGKISLSAALDRAKSDDTLGKMRVSALLASLPGIGAAKSKAIMERTKISENRRIGGLGPHQREALIKQFG